MLNFLPPLAVGLIASLLLALNARQILDVGDSRAA